LQAIAGDDIQLDPSKAEARASSSTVILSCMPALDSITSIWQLGQMSTVVFEGNTFQLTTVNANEVSQYMKQCHEWCIDIRSIVAQSLLEHRKTD
jgi:exosome complex component MTR3